MKEALSVGETQSAHEGGGLEEGMDLSLPMWCRGSLVLNMRACSKRALTRAKVCN